MFFATLRPCGLDFRLPAESSLRARFFPNGDPETVNGKLLPVTRKRSTGNGDGQFLREWVNLRGVWPQDAFCGLGVVEWWSGVFRRVLGHFRA